MQNETYYVRSQGKVSGPFDRSQLISKVSIGQLTGVHSVSTDRQSWILARQIDWLFTPTVGIAPRVLPVAAPAPARQGSAVTIDYDIATPGDAVRTTPPRAPARDLLNEQTRYSSPADAPPPTETTATAKAVFISHSSKDAAIANEIVAAVEAAGISCWIDKREIAPAGNYAEDLMVAIQNCRVMLLICSRHSVGSMHVLREVERASHYQQPVLPIRLDDTELTGALEYLISMAQRIDAFPPPISRHFEAIVAGVQSALGMAYAVPSRQRPDGRQKYVGPFRLIEPLGEGGMGAVFKAEQTSPVKRIVAIKLIKAGFDTAEVIARFESERQALARMNHANIARVLDAGTGEQGRPYFVMEFVPGVPITQFADTHRLSIRARLKLFLQVCDAIAHAHSKSILHRDIKAGNVLAFMLDDRPTVKGIDFGIAKALTGERLTARTLNTSVGKAGGTLAPMAPEQAQGSPAVDTPSGV